MQIAVLGSSGQLAKALARIGATSWRFYSREEVDITSERALSEVLENQYDFVINSTAYTQVDLAEKEKDAALAVNGQALKTLGKLASKYQTKIIHVSTDYVFDGLGHKPYLETDAVSPVNYYGASKLIGENNLMEAQPNSVVIRTSWLYEKSGHNFVNTIKRLAGERDKLTIIADQIGSPTCAADLAAAIINIIEHKIFIPGIYHFSNEGVASWYDFAEEIVSFFNLNCNIFPIPTEQYPTPAKRPYYSVMDKRKIKSDYGLEIAHWRDAFRKEFQ